MRLTLRVLGWRKRQAHACAREGAQEPHGSADVAPPEGGQWAETTFRACVETIAPFLSVLASVPLMRACLRQSDGLIKQKVHYWYLNAGASYKQVK